jgi:hypothetical protein
LGAQRLNDANDAHSVTDDWGDAPLLRGVIGYHERGSRGEEVAFVELMIAYAFTGTLRPTDPQQLSASLITYCIMSSKEDSKMFSAKSSSTTPTLIMLLQMNCLVCN